MTAPSHRSRMERDGVVFPIPVLGAEEIAHCTAGFAELERAQGTPLRRSDAIHLFLRWAYDLVLNERLLDAVGSILGDDVLVHSARIMSKPPADEAWVSWHQDGVHSGIAGPGVTAWVALTDSTAANGCLRVVRGSHRLGTLPYAPGAMTPGNLNRNGDVVQLAIDESDLMDVEIRAGEMSLHDVNAVHGSGPNTSATRRTGVSITYATPAVVQSVVPLIRARGHAACPHLDLVTPAPRDGAEGIEELRQWQGRLPSARAM